MGQSRKGEILEGAEDDIRATYYILAFQREFNDDEAELRWKVVDMMVVGGEISHNRLLFWWRCMPSRSEILIVFCFFSRSFEVLWRRLWSIIHPAVAQHRNLPLPSVPLLLHSFSLPVVLKSVPPVARRVNRDSLHRRKQKSCCC